MSVHVFALQGMLEQDSDNKWIEGETRTVRLILWPTSEFNENKISFLLEGKYLSDHFYISNILDSSYSKNNPEAFVISARATLVSHLKNKQNLKWKIFNKAVNIKYKGPSTIEEKNKLKDVVFIPHDLLRSKSPLYYILGVILGLVILFFGISYFTKKKRERLYQEERNQWKKAITELNSRKDIETIYDNKNVWGKFFDLEHEEINLLLKKINELQYKKDISEKEIKNLKDYANRVRLFHDAH